MELEHQRLEGETEAYVRRRENYEDKELQLDMKYDRMTRELEAEMTKRREEMDAEYAIFVKAKENFDVELKASTSSVEVKYMHPSIYFKYIRGEGECHTFNKQNHNGPVSTHYTTDVHL